MNKVENIYFKLLDMYGPQGWWPINGKYHPNDYSYPKNKNQAYEICIGTILTQNTSWNNVEKALSNLIKESLIDPYKIIKLSKAKLSSVIKSAGYFNQKAIYLKEFTQFFLNNNNPSRSKLLQVKGIGPETADSILLYAYKKPEFVIDAYTRRIFPNLIKPTNTYDDIKNFFETNLKKDYKIYQEYHALIVEHAKRGDKF